MKPLYVSFYTPNYESEARELERTCREFGLDSDIRGLPDAGNWTLNCGMKPGYIRARMDDYPDRSIIWVDADARVRKYPVLFDSLTCDFAAHWRLGSELLSGTMYFGPTLAAKALVDLWCKAQSLSPDEWDQRILQRVIESRSVGPLSIERLPSGYTRVFDDAKMGEPVIEHMQASRRLAKSA